MAGSGRLPGSAGRVLAVLLVLSSCGGAGTAASGTSEFARPVPANSVVEGSVTLESPVLLDAEGAQLQAEHADVVRAVYHALAAGNLDALSELYAGDDWAGQAALLADEAVRRNVLDALGTYPANLGEGYLYPGFSTDPLSDYQGYRTAFFLDYDPPGWGGGPLRWRGIAS